VATRFQDVPLGYCKGHRPWLGAYARENCGAGAAQPSRLLVRSASNAYFAQTMSGISIPDSCGAIPSAVGAVWDEFFQDCESKADVTRERKKQRVSAALEGVSDADVWKEIQRRKGGETTETRGIREVELETLLSAEPEVGDDRPGGIYYARSIAIPKMKSTIASRIERVVKVHRLREVTAQVGFTRFGAGVSGVDGELQLDVERAALARETSWIPAVENRGEGIFIAFSRTAIQKWLERSSVKARGAQLVGGFTAWKRAHTGT